MDKIKEAAIKDRELRITNGQPEWDFLHCSKEPTPLKIVGRSVEIGNERVTIDFRTGAVDIKPIE